MTDPNIKPDKKPEYLVIEMTRQLFHDHYGRRLSSVTQLLDENFIWIGAFDFQETENLDQFRKVTESEYNSMPVSLSDEAYHLLTHSATLWVVLCKFMATAYLEDGKILQIKCRATAVWKRHKGVFKAVHVHTSHAHDYAAPNEMRESTGFFDYIGQFLPKLPSSNQLQQMKISLRDHEGRYHYLYEPEIIRIEAENTYCRIILKGGDFMVRQKISDLEAYLPDTFLRIHKSHLVNPLHVKNLWRYRALLSDGHELPVSRDRYMDIKNKLKSKA